MSYTIMLANGNDMFKCNVTEVDTITIDSGVYTFYDKDNKILFSAPSDALIYLSVD